MNWYFATADGRQETLTELQLQSEVAARRVDGATLVWREGMAEWQRLDAVRPDLFSGIKSHPKSLPPYDLTEPVAVCVISGNILPQSQMLNYGGTWVSPDHKETFLQSLREGVSIGQERPGDGYWTFRDPSMRARLAKIFIVIVSIAGIVISLLGPLGSGDESVELNAVDAVIGILSLLLFPCFIASVVFFCMWTHRVVANAYALGGKWQTISPGWAVGWYFIPIANLWKPFQGLKEAWQTSFETDHVPGMMRLWWGTWLVSNMLDNASMRLALNGEFGISQTIDLISLAVDIPLLIAVFAMISRLTRQQRQRAGLE